MSNFSCPKCGDTLRLPPVTKTTKGRCSHCGHIFVIAAPSTPAVPPPLPSRPAPDSPETIDRFLYIGLGILGLVGAGAILFVITLALRSSQPPPSIAQSPDPTPASQPPAPTPTNPPVSDEPEKPIVATPVTPPPVPVPVPASRVTLSPEELFAKASPAVVRVLVRDRNFALIGQGSGFFISSDGLLVTNYHVIEDAEFASVLFGNNSTIFVDGIAAIDKEHDLALLKVNGTDLPTLSIHEADPPKVGSKVYAIGNPQGLTNTLSEGLISGLRNDGDVVAGIQTTAAISPGSSGGPLLDTTGRVVGVTTSYLTGGQNLNFAIPSPLIRTLIANRQKLVPLASAGTQPLDSDATEELDKVWDAIGAEDWRAALMLLTKFRPAMEKNSSFFWFTAGYVHGKMGNHDMAVDAYKSALAIQPDDAKAYNNMGFAYGNMKRYTEALAAHKSAIAIQPDYAAAYYNMGVTYRNMNRYTEAIAAYKSAIAIQPDFAMAYNNMGGAYHDMKRYAEAIAAFREAVRLDPDGEAGKLARENIAILQRAGQR